MSSQSATLPLPFIHPLAIVETKNIGYGTRIWAWTHIQEEVMVGAYCNIGEHCFLENGVSIGNRVVIKNGNSLWQGVTVADQAFIGPQVIFTNERFPRSGFRKPFEAITIGRGASIGAGAVIVPGVRIGCYATIGAGSVVTRSVADHALVFGNPARFQGWMCVCGLRLKMSNSTDLAKCECGRRYEILPDICRLAID